jgi:hypothetical protein
VIALSCTCLVWSGLVRYGLVWSGRFGSGLVWSVLFWSGLVGLVWFGLVLPKNVLVVVSCVPCACIAVVLRCCCGYHLLVIFLPCVLVSVWVVPPLGPLFSPLLISQVLCCIRCLTQAVMAGLLGAKVLMVGKVVFMCPHSGNATQKLGLCLLAFILFSACPRLRQRALVFCLSFFLFCLCRVSLWLPSLAPWSLLCHMICLLLLFFFSSPFSLVRWAPTPLVPPNSLTFKSSSQLCRAFPFCLSCAFSILVWYPALSYSCSCVALLRLCVCVCVCMGRVL